MKPGWETIPSTVRYGMPRYRRSDGVEVAWTLNDAVWAAYRDQERMDVGTALHPGPVIEAVERHYPLVPPAGERSIYLQGAFTDAEIAELVAWLRACDNRPGPPRHFACWISGPDVKLGLVEQALPPVEGRTTVFWKTKL